MLNENFIKTAKQLHDTEQGEVVKVASLVRKLRNLWRTITSPEHRANVEMLEAETAETLLNATKLAEELETLSAAISDGNLEAYLVVLKSVKQRVKALEEEIDNIRVGANSEFNDVADKLPEGFDLNLDEEYDHSLREFEWFGAREPSLHFSSEKLKTILLGKTAYALGKAFPDKNIREQFFSDDKPNVFMKNFVDAVFRGKIIGRIENTPNGRFFSIRTAPIVMPGNPNVSVVVFGKVKDNARDITGRFAWARTDRVEMHNIGDIEEKPAEEAQPESEPASRGVPAEEIPNTLTSTEQPETIPYSILEESGEPEETTTANRKDELHKLAYSTVPSRMEEISKLALQQQVIPYKVTRLSDVEFADALREGYKMVFGKDPTAETLASAWAQATLESGRPVKLPNNNVGNIKATKAWIDSGQPYFVKDTGEFSKEGKYWVEKGAKWRAYPTPAAGAAGYWKLIGNRYDQAMKWMAAGDPESASVVLGVKGYYTASPKKYATRVGKIYKYFMDNVAPKLTGLQSEPAEPPGPKPVLKNWVADYTEEEKTAILNPADTTKTAPEAPRQDGSFVNSVSKLIKRLTAENNPVTDFVKKSLMKSVPNSNVLVRVRSEASPVEQIEFANVVASLCRRELRIYAQVGIGEDSVIEINCSGKFDQKVLAGAIQELCNMVSRSVQKKTGSYISPIAIAGYSTKNAMLSSDEIIENKRKYDMMRITNG